MDKCYNGSHDFSVEIVKNVTKMPNRGKTGHIDSVNRSKNVVGIGGFYYCGFFPINQQYLFFPLKT